MGEAFNFRNTLGATSINWETAFLFWISSSDSSVSLASSKSSANSLKKLRPNTLDINASCWISILLRVNKLYTLFLLQQILSANSTIESCCLRTSFSISFPIVLFSVIFTFLIMLQSYTYMDKIHKNDVSCYCAFFHNTIYQYT